MWKWIVKKLKGKPQIELEESFKQVDVLLKRLLEENGNKDAKRSIPNNH